MSSVQEDHGNETRWRPSTATVSRPARAVEQTSSLFARTQIDKGPGQKRRPNLFARKQVREMEAHCSRTWKLIAGIDGRLQTSTRSPAVSLPEQYDEAQPAVAAVADHQTTVRKAGNEI